MTDKITFQQLSTLLAKKATISEGHASEFLKNLFDTVTEALQTNTSVTVPHIGTFTLDKHSDQQITFQPATDLAQAINAPFELFTPETLNQGVLLDTPIPATEPTPLIPPTPAPLPTPVADSESKTAETQLLPIPEPTEQNDTEPDTPVSPMPQATAPLMPKPIEEYDDEYVSTQPSRPKADDNTDTDSPSGFWTGFIAGTIVGLALGACAAYFYIDGIFTHHTSKYTDDDDTATESQSELIAREENPALPFETPKPDTATTVPKPDIAPVHTAPSTQPAPQPKAEPKPVTVRVESGFSLAKTAKKYYGSPHFWCYIYEENKAKIRNPNSIAIGTEITIPPAEKYGINPNDPKSISTAKEKVAALNRKFN